MNDIVITEPMVARGTAFCLAAGLEGITREFMPKLLVHAMTVPRTSTRPSKFDPAVAQLILDRLAEGESLRDICSQPGMPDKRTFSGWVTANGLSPHYVRARSDGIDHRFDALRDLAAEANEDNANAVRLRVDTEKWMLSKLKPEKYGDKLAIEHSGSINFGTMPDNEVNGRAIRLLRARLEPVFERLSATGQPVTMDDIVEAFTVTPLPGQLQIEAQGV